MNQNTIIVSFLLFLVVFFLYKWSKKQKVATLRPDINLDRYYPARDNYIKDPATEINYELNESDVHR